MKLGTPAGSPRSNDIRPSIAAATASVCSYTASAARSSLVLISCLHPSMLQLRIDDLVLPHGAKLVFDRNCSKHEQEGAMCYVSCVVTCIGSWVEKRSPNTRGRGGVRLITCFGLEIVSRSQ